MNVFELTGAVDSWGCQRNWVRYNLNKFKGQPVTMRLNSPGGAINEAMAIADAIKQHGDVTVVLVGCCASAATWLCFSAKKVQIQNDAMWMCHNSSSFVNIFKSAKSKDIDNIISELQSQKKSQDAFDAQIAKMYAARTSKNLDDVVALMSEERWMPASEVKEWGFVDELIEGSIPMSNDARAQMLQNCAAFGLPEPTFNVMTKDDHSDEGLFTRIQNYLKDVFGLEPKAANAQEHEQEPAKSEEGAAPQDTDANINNNPQNNQSMKKIINSVVCLLGLLNIKEIEATDDKVTLTVDQMNTIEASLATADKQKKELEEVNETLNAISDEIKDIEGTNNKVKALKMLINRAPGVAPAAANKQEESEAVNDGTDEVNKFFD